MLSQCACGLDKWPLNSAAMVITNALSTVAMVRHMLAVQSWLRRGCVCVCVCAWMMSGVCVWWVCDAMQWEHLSVCAAPIMCVLCVCMFVYTVRCVCVCVCVCGIVVAGSRYGCGV